MKLFTALLALALVASVLPAADPEVEITIQGPPVNTTTVCQIYLSTDWGNYVDRMGKHFGYQPTINVRDENDVIVGQIPNPETQGVFIAKKSVTDFAVTGWTLGAQEAQNSATAAYVAANPKPKGKAKGKGQ